MAACAGVQLHEGDYHLNCSEILLQGNAPNGTQQGHPSKRASAPNLLYGTFVAVTARAPSCSKQTHARHAGSIGACVRDDSVRVMSPLVGVFDFFEPKIGSGANTGARALRRLPPGRIIFCASTTHDER